MITKNTMVGNLWSDIYWNFNLIKHFMEFLNFLIVGSFSAANGSSQCTLCSKGFYQNKMNKTKCEPCAIGSYCRLVFEPLSNTNVVPMLRLIILLFTPAMDTLSYREWFFKRNMFHNWNVYKFRYFAFDFDNFLKE